MVSITKKLRQQNYAKKLREIRPFVNFNFDLRKPLTKHQKAKINKYHKDISALKRQGVQIYRPRSKKHLKAARAAFKHDIELPGYRVAFIPKTGEGNVKVFFDKKGNIHTKSKYVVSDYIALDPLELLRDPEGYVRKKLQNVDADKYAITAGRNELKGTYDKNPAIREIVRIVNSPKYHNPESNHYAANWLHGVRPLKFKNQESFEHYMRDKAKLQKQKQENKRKFKNLKRQQQRDADAGIIRITPDQMERKTTEKLVENMEFLGFDRAGNYKFRR